jgi:hypothetical protein
MITCISPAAENTSESLSTLRFASRAKRIVNHAQKNEFLEAKSLATKFALQKAELDELRERFELSKMLGFDADGEKGRSLKAKAIDALKNMKILKFYMRHVPKIIKALQSQGNFEVSKQVNSDLRAVLMGQKDPVEVIEEHLEIVTPYFPEDMELIIKMRSLAFTSDSEILEEDYFEEQMGGVENHVEMFGFGDDDNVEKYENSQMKFEDALAKDFSIVNVLKIDIAERMKNESNLIRQISALSENGSKSQESIMKYVAIEGQLLQEVDGLRAQLDSDGVMHKNKISELTRQLDEHESAVTSNQGLIKSLQENLATTKTSLEESLGLQLKLKAELKQANQLRISFEDELQKSRTESRIQLDKLRSNMSLIMKAGGEESKVIEMQNQEFMKENYLLKDELVNVNQANVILIAEVSQVRREMERLREFLRISFEENTKLSVEITNTQRQLHLKDTELSQVGGKLFSVENDCSQLERRFHIEMDRKDKMYASKIEEHNICIQNKDELIERLNAQLSEVQELNLILKNDLETKASVSMKVEQQHLSEIVRLEKNVSQTPKRIAKLQHDHKEYTGKMNESFIIFQREKEELLFQISLLQETISEVTSNAKMVQSDAYNSAFEVKSDEGDIEEDENADRDREFNRISSHSILATRKQSIAVASAEIPYLSTFADESARKALYESYLEKRLSYAMDSQFNASVNSLKSNSYFSLRSALEIASLSLSFTTREEKYLLGYLFQENRDILNRKSIAEERSRGLEVVNSTLSENHTQIEHEIRAENEKVVNLKALNDIFRSQLHECKLKITELTASDLFKTNKISMLEKESETSMIYLSNAKHDIEQAYRGKDELIAENLNILGNLSTAHSEIKELEKRFDRLHQQASIIEKERNELVRHFLELKV